MAATLAPRASLLCRALWCAVHRIVDVLLYLYGLNAPAYNRGQLEELTPEKYVLTTGTTGKPKEIPFYPPASWFSLPDALKIALISLPIKATIDRLCGGRLRM